MHLCIHFAIVTLLINDQSLRARLNDRNVIGHFHRPDLNRDRGKIGGECANTIRQITLSDEPWVLACDQQNLSKTLLREVPRLSHHLIEIERYTQNWIVA